MSEPMPRSINEIQARSCSRRAHGPAFALAIAAGATIVLASTITAGQSGSSRPLSANPAAPGQSETANLERIAQIPMGSMNAVALDGDRAYLGLGPRLAVIDLSAPEAPRMAGFGDVLDDDVRAIHVDPAERNRVFVAAGAEGLRVYDVSQSETPRETTRVEGYSAAIQVTPERVYALGGPLRILDRSSQPPFGELARIDLPIESFHVAGQIAWLAVGEAGIMAYDLADPSRPTPIAALDTPGHARDIRVAGQLGYVVDGGRVLSILDLSTPTAPAWISDFTIDLADDSDCPPNGGDCGVEAHWVRVVGDRALLGSRRYLGAFGNRVEARLVLIDVSDPLRPRAIAQRGMRDNPSAIALDGTRSLVSAHPLWWYAGIAPCQLSPGGLHLFDTDLQDIGRLDLAVGANTIAIHADEVFSTDHSVRVRSYALNDPLASRLPAATGYGASYGSPEARDLVVDVTGARYVLGGQTAGFLSLADTAIQTGGEAARRGPAVVARAPGDAPLNGCAPPNRDQWFDHIATDGRHDYLLDQAGGLQVFEIGQYHPLSRLDDVDANDLASRNGRIYLAGPDGLDVIDASDPTAPIVSGSLSLVGRERTIAVSKQVDLAVVAGSTGLSIVDLRTPESPRQLSTVPMDEALVAVAIQGHTVYAASESSLLAFDLADATAPVQHTQVEGLRGIRSLAISGNHLAILSTGGVSIYQPPVDDRSPPLLPQQNPIDPSPIYLPSLLRDTTIGAVSPSPGVILQIADKGAFLSPPGFQQRIHQVPSPIGASIVRTRSAYEHFRHQCGSQPELVCTGRQQCLCDPVAVRAGMVDGHQTQQRRRLHSHQQGLRVVELRRP